MESDSNTVGSVLRSMRVRANFSIKTAAPKVGVSYTYLSKVENGIKTPSQGLVTELCKIYGEDPDIVIAMLGGLPIDIQEIILKHGKDAYDLLRNTYSDEK